MLPTTKIHKTQNILHITTPYTYRSYRQQTMKRAASSSSSAEGTEREPPKNSSHEASGADRVTATATAPVVVKKQKVQNVAAAAVDGTPEAAPRQAVDTNEEDTKEEETNEEKETKAEEAEENAAIHLLLVPQLELMPLIPAQPPTVPLTDEEEVALTKKYRYKYQTRPAPVYKAKDYALWPGKLPQTVFASQKNIHNAVFASEYMRTWFAQYHGLRTPPPKAARSAYALYYNAQKTQWKDTHGKWSQKRDSKKCGTMWQQLPGTEKATYEHQHATSHAQYTINTEYWHAEAAKWRTAKIQQLLVQQQQQANGGEGAESSLAVAVEQQVTALIEAISRD